VRDLSAQTQPPINVANRQSGAVSPSGKRQSPILRPDSTVMSEERGTVPDTSEPERTQPTSCFSASDSVASGLSTTQSQRPPLWNPFLAAVTAASRVPGGDGEFENRPCDVGTVPPAKVGAGTKHLRAGDDETLTPAKKRKTTNSEVHESSSCVELSDASRRPSGQSPSSSTLDTPAAPTHNGDPATTDAPDSGSGGLCAPDSSCDEQLSTPDVKRFEHANKSAVPKDLTVVGGVQETSSLVPLATQ